MEKVKLQAQVRDTSSKSNLKKLRQDGRIAASVYGHGVDSVSISLELSDLVAAVKTEAGLHALMDIEIEGGRKKDKGVVVIKRVQKDPITRKVVHVDFQRVTMTEKLTTEVSIVFIGNAAGALEGGVVEHVMDSIQVRCLPDKIPSHMDLDISDLELGQALHVKDLPLPEGVEALTGEGEVVVAVRLPHVHIEEVAEAVAEGAAPAEEAVSE
ncbi:MAG: 50S ribosomal protein L25 [Armatimonadota bacterium]|nr:50S ribosomal protein L25 [Armatimonadota bacterium]